MNYFKYFKQDPSRVYALIFLLFSLVVVLVSSYLKDTDGTLPLLAFGGVGVGVLIGTLITYLRERL